MDKDTLEAIKIIEDVLTRLNCSTADIFTIDLMISNGEKLGKLSNIIKDNEERLRND